MTERVKRGRNDFHALPGPLGEERNDVEMDTSVVPYWNDSKTRGRRLMSMQNHSDILLSCSPDS